MFSGLCALNWLMPQFAAARPDIPPATTAIALPNAQDKDSAVLKPCAFASLYVEIVLFAPPNPSAPNPNAVAACVKPAAPKHIAIDANADVPKLATIRLSCNKAFISVGLPSACCAFRHL